MRSTPKLIPDRPEPTQYNEAMPLRKRTRPRMLAIRGALLLLAGAIVNVAVAWGCALWEPQQNSGFVDVTERLPAIFAKYGLALQHDENQSGFQGSGFGLTFTSADHEVEPTQILMLTEAGWPARSLGGAIELTVPLSGTPVAAFHSALELSPSIRPRNPVMPQLAFVLPLRPIWPGFAINTVLYAAVLWLLLTWPGRLRRFLRLRGSLCPTCAYPIGTNDVCTECGTPITQGRTPESR